MRPGDRVKKAYDCARTKGSQKSFCVPLELLEPLAIKELRKRHPGALIISAEYVLRGDAGDMVLWWIEGPIKEEAENAQGR